MKKKAMISLAMFFVGGLQLLHAEAVSVVVPKQYLIEKASLVLYMLDGLGHQCVGTCRLDEVFERRNILQQDLLIQESDSLTQLLNSIEITNSSHARDNEVMLHIEFDSDVRVVRILIVKENFSEKDSFDTLSIAVADDQGLDDFDALSDLIDGIDSSTMRTVATVKQNSSWNQYGLYAKIYCMMQYKQAKRKMKYLTAWLCKKR